MRSIRLLGKEISNRTLAVLSILILLVSGTTGALVGLLFRSGAYVPEPSYEPLDVSIGPWSFANYTEFKTNYTLNAPQYTVEPDLSNVINRDYFALTDEMMQAIADHYFVAVPTDFKMFYDIYEWNHENEIPSFVTSDAILHAYHVLFDLSLRGLEEEHFADGLYSLMLHMVEVSLRQYHEISDPLWRECAKKNVAYFSVAARLLNSSWDIPEVVAPWVENVLLLIRSASGFSSQWFMQQTLDWTQFIPRGHYTKSQRLEQYFKAVMWLSRVAFRLKPQDFFPLDNPLNLERGRNETAQAILLCVAMRQLSSVYSIDSLEPMRQWATVFDTISFFIGASDDLSLYEYQAIIDTVYDNPRNYTELTNPSRLGVFMATADNLRPPQILSCFLEDFKSITGTKGLRFLGQRFVPDSYVFSELTHSQVPFRCLPKALDIMAALGSERAWELLEDEKSYTNYTEQMMMLREMFSNFTMDSWTQSLYWLWLYSFKTLLMKPAPGHPSFMRVSEWVDKQLVTCLGTWTELRHDTILYTKQSYSYYYGMPTPPPGYVEPVPELFARVASLCDMLRTGLAARQIDDIDVISKLEDLQWLVLRLKSISEKELSGVALDESDEQLLRNIGDYIADIEGTKREGGRAALVADVHTDSTTGTVLEEATGNPMCIIVAVPDHEGNVFLAQGAMYSHYEFTVPMSNRLSDEAWWLMLEGNETPPMADWVSSFVLGDGASGSLEEGQSLVAKLAVASWGDLRAEGCLQHNSVWSSRGNCLVVVGLQCEAPAVLVGTAHIDRNTYLSRSRSCG
ncbi:MAG: hypothetical protein DRO93_12560 [Candidatus Thorarchaeota archaeon]|nr:MAG: hypothetical protein DRO93_12560 [Candidatus Thorarchaeota archaeon]